MNQNSIEKARKLLANIDGALGKAVYFSASRALTHTALILSKEIRKEYSVKARTARSAISKRIQKKKGHMNAQISVKGPNLFAQTFNLRPKTDTTGSKRREVRLGIRKSELKPVDRGFVSKGVLLQRKTSSSLPVEPVFGPSVAGMAANENVVEAVQKSFDETFERRLDHEVKRLLSKGTKSK